MTELSRIEQLKAFLKEDPNDTFLNYALATEYIGVGDDVKAREIFLGLMDRQPDYSPTYYHLGKLYERTGEQDKAEECYTVGVEVCRKNKELKNLNEMQTALTNLMFDE